ncbi:CPBP family intramembrane glutamic endopeptidase [Glycomyces sp. NRRL B-16210]|uniref:CPBP family intramembrane glutamic endopeptidase n=1 Tax=Glycomyces sp. NRRL B-16210 TaxID=1463821 RepID=UPI00068CDD21|nr:CPBP family intramembrane glutamic endopeptidase [Glycomyces sp. NRRL B-16210]
MNHTQVQSRPVLETPPPEPRLGLGPVGIAVRAVVAVGVLFGANFLVAGLFALLMAVPGLEGSLTENPLAATVASVLLHACVLTVTVVAVRTWMRLVERRDLRDAGWRWTRHSAGWLLLAILVAGGLVVAAIAVLPATGPVSTEADVNSASILAFGLIGIVSQAFLLQAIPEELLYRGWLLSTMRTRPVLAIAVTTLTFTVIHLASNGGQTSFAEQLIYLALPFGFSLLAVGMQLWTGSLWAAIGVHGGFHLGNTAAMLLLPQVDPVRSWIVIGALHSIVGTVLIVTALRRGRHVGPGR